MADKITTILPFVRKHKPRAVPVRGSAPSHAVVRAPRAIVEHNESVVRDVLHSSPTPRRISLESSLFPHERRSSSNILTLRPSSLSTVVPSAHISKPRKRFRKKVNGLFGDQTELKKRMSKLIRDSDALNTEEGSRGLEAGPNDCENSSGALLPAAKSIIAHLEATGQSIKSGSEANEESARMSDSFDFVKLTETACKVVGSPERLAVLRRTMGTLSPRRNDRFIEELKLGKSSPAPRNPEQDCNGLIAPPPRPIVVSDVLRRDIEKLGAANLSPVSVDRTGAPAVLRCRARRLDRGYRCADVLRARLHSSTLAESAVMFAATKSSGSTVDSADVIGSPTNRRYLEHGAKDEKGSLVEKNAAVRMRMFGGLENDHESTDENRRRKRRRRSQDIGDEDGDENRSVSQYTNGSSNASEGVNDSLSDEEDDADGRDDAHNPLKMLVEAATRRSESVRSTMIDVVGRGNKKRKRARTAGDEKGSGVF